MVDIARTNRNNSNTAGPATAVLDKPNTDQATRAVPGGIRPTDHQPQEMATDAPPTRPSAAVRYLLAGIRLALGFIFLWAFLDKTFGLGFATASAKSWINGGSPTGGFLGSAKGPFASFYHTIAGTPVADVLFMTALFAIGTVLILGIGMRVAAAAGALLTLMMWSAVLPPTSNPFMDDHLIYAAILIVLALLAAGNTAGLGRAWAAIPAVQRNPWLK